MGEFWRKSDFHLSIYWVGQINILWKPWMNILANPIIPNSSPYSNNSRNLVSDFKWKERKNLLWFHEYVMKLKSWVVYPIRIGFWIWDLISVSFTSYVIFDKLFYLSKFPNRWNMEGNFYLSKLLWLGNMHKTFTMVLGNMAMLPVGIAA